VAQTIAESESSQRRLRTDLTAAYADLRAADGRARAQHESVLPAAQESADLALEAYRAGRVDINAVVAAQQAFAEARANALRADAEVARAAATLAHAAGGWW
jgi:outer membrane protein TolC